MHIDTSLPCQGSCFWQTNSLISRVAMFYVLSEVRLLELLPFASQCEDGEEQVLRFIYEDRLKKVS